MTKSKSWVPVLENQQAVLSLYRDVEKMLTVEQIAQALGTGHHNVGAVLRLCMPEAERKALAALRYSRSKAGANSPHFGKRGPEHHNWKGDCEDGRGYLTRMWHGQRTFVHQIVLMEHLGLKSLPEGMAVHHIDSNPKNNVLDNLALVTNTGHNRIHFLQVKDSAALSSRKSTLEGLLRSLISK